MGESAPPPVFLSALRWLSGGSTGAAATTHHRKCSSHNRPRSRSPGQKHGPGQRVSDISFSATTLSMIHLLFAQSCGWTLNTVSSAIHTLCVPDCVWHVFLLLFQPHHGAFRGSDRQTRERHVTAGASAALFQDAWLRWQQPAGWAGARHCYHTCTQRGRYIQYASIFICFCLLRCEHIAW